MARGAFPWSVLLSVALVLLVLVSFVRTGDVMMLVFGSVLLVNVLGALYVWRDAPKRGMDRLPWALVTLVTGALGLLAYLVVRELRKPAA